MNDEQLLRYSKHIMLPQIDYAGQKKLTQAKVAIIGIGGLGSPVATYLASSGIGHLTIVDPDTVALDNLQRQIIYSTQDIGKPKVVSAKEKLIDNNPNIEITSYQEALHQDNINELLAKSEIVVDASDNFKTRYLINQYCVSNHKPLISGAVIGFSGQVIAFKNQDNNPCYYCLYPDNEQQQSDCCSEQGVLAPLVGVIGCMQAVCTIKSIIGFDKDLYHKLHIFDAHNMHWQGFKLNQDNECPICKWPKR